MRGPSQDLTHPRRTSNLLVIDPQRDAVLAALLGGKYDLQLTLFKELGRVENLPETFDFCPDTLSALHKKLYDLGIRDLPVLGPVDSHLLSPET